MCQISSLRIWDLGQVIQVGRPPLPTRQGIALSFFPLHLSLDPCHWYISKHILDSSFIPPYCVQAECPSLPSQPSSFLKFFNCFFFHSIPLATSLGPRPLCLDTDKAFLTMFLFSFHESQIDNRWRLPQTPICLKPFPVGGPSLAAHRL